jgi:hypothetical protein
MASGSRDGRTAGWSPEVVASMLQPLSAAQLRELAAGLVAFAPADAGLGLGPPPRRRRPRQEVESTYRVRVDLREVRPPVWRRLELSSHLGLDELHGILQTAFSWTDSHLHRFASGTSVWDRDAEIYLCPFDVEEGEDPHGVPESEVRLDEVLAEAGDRLHYAYDYGDGWEHVVRLEAVLPRSSRQPRAVCTAGRRATPPEDCGGVPGYEELLAAGQIDDEPIDLAQLNVMLTEALAGREHAVVDGPDLGLVVSTRRRIEPPPVRSVGDLLPQLGGEVRRAVAALVEAARLDEPVLVDAETAAAAVARYSWLLARVGDGGITLTSAGYLPPRDVEAAWQAFGLDEEWYGKGNREVHVYPVLHVRETAQRTGLLRKHRGRLLLTKRGKALRADPVGLWWHIAATLRPDDDSLAAHAGLVMLLGAAAGENLRSDHFEQLVDDVLAELGWPDPHGYPADPTIPVWRALVHLGTVMAEPLRDGLATPGGRLLARAALTVR